jgi:hypothetical protein
VAGVARFFRRSGEGGEREGRRDSNSNPACFSARMRGGSGMEVAREAGRAREGARGRGGAAVAGEVAPVGVWGRT